MQQVFSAPCSINFEFERATAARATKTDFKMALAILVLESPHILFYFDPEGTRSQTQFCGLVNMGTRFLGCDLTSDSVINDNMCTWTQEQATKFMRVRLAIKSMTTYTAIYNSSKRGSPDLFLQEINWQSNLFPTTRKIYMQWH